MNKETGKEPKERQKRVREMETWRTIRSLGILPVKAVAHADLVGHECV